MKSSYKSQKNKREYVSKVIALPTIALSLKCKRATTIAVAIVGRVIPIWEVIQKRSHEPIYKTYTKIWAKRLRATSFAIGKLE